MCTNVYKSKLLNFYKSTSLKNLLSREKINVNTDPIDFKKCINELPSKDAYFQLGCYYEDIEKNYSLMKECYLEAIKLNNTDAMVNLGCYYSNVEKNNAMALKYFEMAAAHNDKLALTNLGCHYQYVEVDNKKMICYYKEVLSKEWNSVASNNLAFYYGQMGDYESMKQVYLDGVVLRDASSMNLLGDYFQFVEKDMNYSIRYYLMAANLGDHDAWLKLVKYYLTEENNIIAKSKL